MPTLFCPECGYNLTGLDRDRCPECGEVFSAEQLMEVACGADILIRRIKLKMVLYPLLYAVLMPCWLGMPVGTTDQHSPIFWVVLICLISAVPVLLPPIWTGWTLGMQYAQARKARSTEKQVEKAVRSDRVYAFWFSAWQTLLMFIYFGLGVLLFFFFVFAVIFP